ncbi:hypothetical protein EPR50_G00142570 [Perca flavescens]|uniref:FIIND domain-containing protein n=1 Tax=Perca flavescens TaxID=8167 RepID=A0A484CPD5_PERFV|nr:hypothetical protein EPR50_G00142570 [Perca flavescens]
MSSKLLEKKWKRALSSMLEQLIEQQFAEMLLNLDKIPLKVKTDKSRRSISVLIVQNYGIESIAEIDRITKKTPINDAAVQKLLSPFVEELNKQRQGKKSFQCDAGHFECSVSALRWVCEEKLSFRFQFCSWDEHRVRLSATAYMPAGPLLDITVTAGKMEEVQLPHWICVDHKSKMSDNFAVLHIDTCGDVWREVSEVTRCHVKLLQPTFSLISVAFRWLTGPPGESVL